MLRRKLDDRLSALIDDLLQEGSVSASLLASILLSAQDSVKDGTIAALAMEVWKKQRLGDAAGPPTEPTDTLVDLEHQLHSRLWRSRLLVGSHSGV